MRPPCRPAPSSPSSAPSSSSTPSSAGARSGPSRSRRAAMPTLEIDGQRIEVPDGLTVIQAAERLGIEIPHYCWHPGLSIAGNCRMCLVEIEKNPKLQIACNTRVADGMVVRTTSDKTKAAQRAVLEFLLINHPIDCPVCDQAGECKLQEYYMDYDRQRSRVPLPAKVRKKKAIPIGPLVMLDQERCILCARCTRFLDEVTHTSELAIYERGDHCEIELAPGRVLDNPYSGNVVDICPVGAVVSAQAPNEEVFLLRRLGAALGARMAGISWSPPGAFHDDFLVKADKNPNTSGLRLQGLGDAGAVDDLIQAAAAGELRALVLHRTDLTAWRDAAAVQAALERVPCLVVIDTDRREVAAYADVVLPLATYAECDGTFTNHAGRVQRFHTAVAPPAEARPGWAVLGELVARLGGGEPPASAAAAFVALASEC